MALLFDGPSEVAPGVLRVPLRVANAYFVGEAGEPWVLVDAGLPSAAAAIRRAARARYGTRPPEAILLTHGHADHAGAARYLAGAWKVPVYAHALELPHLTGQAPYPPYDAAAGGPLGVLARVLPNRPLDLSGRVFALPPGGAVPGLPGWRWIGTPGHTAGHVAYFRQADGVLLAGDAVATMNLDSALCYAERPPGLYRPPAPFTGDSEQARASISRLAALRPGSIAAGHGRPLRADDLAGRLHQLAEQLDARSLSESSAHRSGLLPSAGALGATLGAAAWAWRRRS